MGLKIGEIIGEIALFIPGISTVAGAIMATVYYKRTKEDPNAIKKTEETASKIDATVQDKLMPPKKESLKYDQNLYRASLWGMIPGVNIFAAIYSAIILKHVSDLRNASTIADDRKPSESKTTTERKEQLVGSRMADARSHPVTDDGVVPKGNLLEPIQSKKDQSPQSEKENMLGQMEMIKSLDALKREAELLQNQCIEDDDLDPYFNPPITEVIECLYLGNLQNVGGFLLLEEDGENTLGAMHENLRTLNIRTVITCGEPGPLPEQRIVEIDYQTHSIGDGNIWNFFKNCQSFLKEYMSAD